MSYTYDYPRPSLTVDACVFTWQDDLVRVLLVKRKHEPFQAMHALPGGFVDIDEPLDDAVARELTEETSLSSIGLEQFRTFGTPGRDPRGRTVSVVYLGLVRADEAEPAAGDDAAEADWMPLDALPAKMAFDHSEVLAAATDHLKQTLLWGPGPLAMLPRRFNCDELGRMIESLLGRRVNRLQLCDALQRNGLLVRQPGRSGDRETFFHMDNPTLGRMQRDGWPVDIMEIIR